MSAPEAVDSMSLAHFKVEVLHVDDSDGGTRLDALAFSDPAQPGAPLTVTLTPPGGDDGLGEWAMLDELLDLYLAWDHHGCVVALGRDGEWYTALLPHPPV